ncbi:MAG: response regulator [Verrucomicrobiota bacterium]
MSKTRPLVAIVDDEEPIRKALTRLLRSGGLDVESFPSGSEFLESLPAHRPDCVVLDLHMPVVNGFDVQARLVEFGVPVVIITGHDSDETRARALAGRPAAYLRKPVNDQVLLDAIELALGLNRERENKQ